MFDKIRHSDPGIRPDESGLWLSEGSRFRRSSTKNWGLWPTMACRKCPVRRLHDTLGEDYYSALGESPMPPQVSTPIHLRAICTLPQSASFQRRKQAITDDLHGGCIGMSSSAGQRLPGPPRALPQAAQAKLLGVECGSARNRRTTALSTRDRFASPRNRGPRLDLRGSVTCALLGPASRHETTVAQSRS